MEIQTGTGKKENLMSEHIVDQMIADVRRATVAKQTQRQEMINRRREKALYCIGEAAEKHGLFSGQDKEVVEKQKDLVFDRLFQAKKARVSEAEAMGQLAETVGDFDSPLLFWEIRSTDSNMGNGRGAKQDSRGEDGVLLWKGYVVARRVCRIRACVSFDGLREGSGEPEERRIYLDLNVRRACSGGYVASAHADGGTAVGFSGGEEGTPDNAMIWAYLAFFQGVKKIPLQRDDLPPEIIRILAVDNKRVTR